MTPFFWTDSVRRRLAGWLDPSPDVVGLRPVRWVDADGESLTRERYVESVDRTELRERGLGDLASALDENDEAERWSLALGFETPDPMDFPSDGVGRPLRRKTDREDRLRRFDEKQGRPRVHVGDVVRISCSSASFTVWSEAATVTAVPDPAGAAFRTDRAGVPCLSCVWEIVG